MLGAAFIHSELLHLADRKQCRATALHFSPQVSGRCGDREPPWPLAVLSLYLV